MQPCSFEFQCAYTHPLAIYAKIVEAATQLMSLYWIRKHLNLHKKFVALTFILFKFWQLPPTNMIPICEVEREFALIVETTKGVVGRIHRDCLSWLNESEHWNAFVIGYSSSCLLYTFNVAIAFLYCVAIFDEKNVMKRERERRIGNVLLKSKYIHRNKKE
jgi:hypothetical protein